MTPGLGRLLALGRFRTVILGRGLAVWIAIRLAAAFLEAGRLNVLQSVFVVAVAGTAVTLDARRRNEDLFLANLGISPQAVFVLSTVAPVLGEVLATLVL